MKKIVRFGPFLPQIDEVPFTGKPVHVGVYQHKIYMWIEEQKSDEKKYAKLFATDQEFGDEWEHFGTVIEPIGYVWHLAVRKE